jgi:hypothetical protein
MSTGSTQVSGLSADGQAILSWLRDNSWGGRPPVYSVQEIARGVFGRTEGPAPGTTFDPTAWGRLRQAIVELEQRGLIVQGRLPQGDFGYALAA